MNTVRIPVISLYGTLIVSIQFDMSDELLSQLKADVSSKIDLVGAGHLIIDVSGIEVMDSYITRGLCDLALVARLMGVETVICGLQPAVASTLLEMGFGLRGIVCALNLEHAMDLARSKARDAEPVDG